jgi:hypothetical protein
MVSYLLVTAMSRSLVSVLIKMVCALLMGVLNFNYLMAW